MSEILTSLTTKQPKVRLRRWIISDTHLGHSAIQKHTRRPADVDQRITKAWDRMVWPTDLVIHLGDVCFNAFDIKTWLSDRPGRKWLVRGNHDPHTISWYLEHGFGFAADAIELGGTYFTHKPSQFLPPGCSRNVHGHLHNRFPATYRKYPHSRLFTLEYTKYEPMLLETFLQKGCPGGEVIPFNGCAKCGSKDPFVKKLVVLPNGDFDAGTQWDYCDNRDFHREDDHGRGSIRSDGDQ